MKGVRNASVFSGRIVTAYVPLCSSPSESVPEHKIKNIFLASVVSIKNLLINFYHGVILFKALKRKVSPDAKA